MIVYYLGIPGSGKTYASVDIIYNNFTDYDDAKKDLKKDYKSCFTNINEFKFEKCNNVYKFDYDLFYKQITELYTMYKDKKSDDELINKAKEFNLYKTLFVIDECHNFLAMADKVLIWWLTYHRHLYHDIILITQNLQLVNTKYKPLAEAFYKAKSSSLTLNSKYFNYMYYTESRLTKASFVSTKKVLKRQGVFDLYKSGDSVESKNVIMRFIYISVFLLIVFLFFGYLYVSSRASSDDKFNDNSPKQSNNLLQPQESDHNVSRSSLSQDDLFDVSSVVLVEFICTNDMCSYKDKYFDIKVLTYAKDYFYFHIINSRRSFASVYLSCSVDQKFLQFILGGTSDEVLYKDSSISLFGSGSK